MMIELDLDQINNKKVAILCKTKELALEFMKFLYDNGVTWNDGDSVSSVPYYIYGDHQCYNLEDSFTLLCDDASVYKSDGWEIIDLENFIVSRIDIPDDKLFEFLSGGNDESI